MVGKNRRVAVAASWALAALLLAAGCMKSPEEQYQAYMESAQAYLEKGDPASAIIEFKNAARAQPEQAEPYFQMAKAQLAQRQVADAAAAVQQAVQLDPSHSEANLLLAQLMVRLGGPDVLPRAEQLINSVLADNRDNPEALFVLAATRAKMGESQDAEQLLEETLAKTPAHLQSSLALARLKLSQGDQAGAEKVLRDAVAQAEDKKPARVVLAQFLLGAGRPQDALEEYQGILRDDPNYGPAMLGVAMVHMSNEERDKAEEAYRRASELDDPRYRALYGEALLVNGKSDEAIAEFKRLTEAHPDDRQYRGKLAGAYLLAGKTDEADQVLSAAIEKTPKDTDARLQRAELYRRLNRLDEAQADLAQVLDLKPDSFQAHYVLSKIHEARGDARLQRQSLDEALRANPSFLQARLDLANNVLRSDSPQAALDILDQAPEQQRNNAQLLAARVWALISAKQTAEARQLLDQILKAQQEPAPEFLVQDGVLKNLANDYRGARVSLEKALESNPLDLRAVNALAGSYAAEQKLDLAMAFVENHAAKHPDNVQLQLNVASWHERLRHREQARAAYQRVRELDKGNTLAALALARMAGEDGDAAKAIPLLDEVIEANPRMTAARLMKGTLLEGQNRRADALAEYRAVVELQPDNVVALNNAAYLLAVEQNQVDEALKLAQRAKELAPENAMIDDTLGWIYYLKGVYPMAVRHIQAAADKAGESAVIHYHLAMAHAKAGNPTAGKAAYDAAFKMDATLPEANEAKAVLAQAGAK